MATIKQFKNNCYLLTDPANPEDPIDILASVLSSGLKSQIGVELDAIVPGLLEQKRQKVRDGIRKLALELPVDDPLRLVIEGVPE